jgi:preprotein translocase subunit YajC
VNAAEFGFIVIVGVIVAFYLIVIRPMTQEQKRQQADIRDLKVGDEVLTTGGLIATVKEIRIPDQGHVEVILSLAPGVDVKAIPAGVSRRLRAADGSAIGAAPGPRGKKEAGA